MKPLAVPPSPTGQAILTALQHAIAGALERKRHLGQYSVVWTDGVTRLDGADAPSLVEALPAATPLPTPHLSR